MSSALCRPLLTPVSRTCHSVHFPSFPPPASRVWNHLLHTSAPGEASILLHLLGSWRGPSAFPRLVRETSPRQPRPDQLCSRPAQMLPWWTGHSSPGRVRSVGLSSVWSNLAHMSPTLGSGPKPAQCSFICLTLALLCVPQGRGNCSWDSLYCLLNPVPSPPVPHCFRWFLM